MTIPTGTFFLCLLRKYHHLLFFVVLVSTTVYLSTPSNLNISLREKTTGDRNHLILYSSTSLSLLLHSYWLPNSSFSVHTWGQTSLPSTFLSPVLKFHFTQSYHCHSSLFLVPLMTGRLNLHRLFILPF